MDLNLGENTKIHPIWVWHPSVHARFKEQLCYFLIAVKPYDRAAFNLQLQTVLDRYGVKRECHFELLGGFDILLRVWLVQGLRGVFEQHLFQDIRNCENVLSFQVDRAIIPWGFTRGFAPSDEALQNLTIETIRSVQSSEGANKEIISVLLTDKVLADATPSDDTQGRSIKGFIAISAWPRFYGNAVQREDFIRNLERYLLDSSHDTTSVAIYEGIGFSWILVKLVVENFYTLGRIVDWIHGKYSIHGVSTTTFVVSESVWRQGEAISELALKGAIHHDQTVYQVLPALYDSRNLSPQEEIDPIQVAKMETAVKRVRELARKGSIAKGQDEIVWDFLNAVLQNNKLDCFAILYKPLGHAEAALRRNLKMMSGRVLGGTDQLIQQLNVRQASMNKRASVAPVPAKSIDRLSLGDLTEAWSILFAASDPEGGSLELDLKGMGKVVEMRNVVMHCDEFDPAREWEAWLQNLLVIFQLLPRLENKIAVLVEKYTAKSTTST